MLDPDVKIIRQQEDARYELDGTATYLVRVEFMVGKDGPFVERIEKTAFLAGGRDDQVNAYARVVRTR